MQFTERLKKINLIWYLLALTLTVYFFFAFSHLTQFETADERYWVADSTTGRIQRYWTGIQTGNLALTYINDKPGVSLAYVSGIGMLFENDPEAKIIHRGKAHKVYDPAEFRKMLGHFRAPLVIFIGLMGAYFFWLILRITEREWLALLAVSLILLSPIILGIAQIINPDTMLWIFSLATLLTFMLFLKSGHLSQAGLAAWWLGWAFLSKYTALILVPFLFLMAGAYFLFGLDREERHSRHAAKVFMAYPFVVALSLLVFMIFLPASFGKPSLIFGDTIEFKNIGKLFVAIGIVDALIVLDALWLKSRIFFGLVGTMQSWRRYLASAVFAVSAVYFILALANWATGSNFLGLPWISFDAGRSNKFLKLDLYQQLFLQVKFLVFTLVPFVLVGMLAGWIRSSIRFSKENFLPLMITCFLIAFYVAVTLQELMVHVRYSIILYPLAAILAAYGIHGVLELERRKTSFQLAVYAAVILLSVYSLDAIRPWYFNYTSDLLPKVRNITGAWGYGGYEAAEYLNRLPNAEKTLVWSDYRGFCPFYKGPCLMGSDYNGWQKDPEIKDQPIAYFVKTRRGTLLNKKLWDKLEDRQVNINSDPVWQLIIGERENNYVRVYANMRNSE